MCASAAEQTNERTNRKEIWEISQPSAHTYAYSIGWFVCWLAWSNANDHVCCYWCCNYLEVAVSRSKIYESSAREKFAENSIIFIDILCFFRLFICSCWQNWAWKLFIWFFLRHGQHFSYGVFCVGGWKKAKVDWNIKIHSGGLLVPRAHSGEGGVNCGKRFWLGNEMQCQAIDEIRWTDVWLFDLRSIFPQRCKLCGRCAFVWVRD